MGIRGGHARSAPRAAPLSAKSPHPGAAGPTSDIDLLLHFGGSEAQRAELLVWLEGWSRCLAEVNFLRTGCRPERFLDVYLVTDAEIVQRTSLAVKIDAITDPARKLPMKEAG